jgi:hypothetical protein
MEANRATALTTDYFRLVDRATHGHAYDWMRHTLMELLPEGTPEASAAVTLGEDAAVVCLLGDALFVLTAQVGEGHQVQITVEQKRLLDGVQLRVVENPVDRLETGIQARFRRWSLAWPSGDSVTFDGIVRSYAAFGGRKPDDAELLGRALAAKLDWLVPQEDD